MKERSFQNIFYKASINLFVIFLFSFVFTNAFITYNFFLEQKQILEKQKESLTLNEENSKIDELILRKKAELFNGFIIDIFMLILLAFIFILISFLYFKSLKQEISLDINLLIDEFKNLLTKNQEIDLKQIKFIEFQKIVSHSNFLYTKKNELQEELKRKELIMHQQAKMAAMGEMLENIAHQWRQPLSVITIATSGIQIQRDLNMLDDKYFDDSLKMIDENIKYLSNTIEDFRNFFLKDENIQSFKTKELSDIVFNLLDSKFKSIDINLIKDIEDFELKSLKNALIQILMIILNNAKDALENINTNKYIFIKIYEEKDFCFIKIKDNANGIKEEYLSKVFEAYFTTKHQSRGTGIGLFMAQELILKHLDGDIFVKNEQYIYEENSYLGAEFCLKIPKKLQK